MGDSRSKGGDATGGSCSSSDYWDAALGDWTAGSGDRLWRAHADAVNRGMVERWLGAGSLDSVLKTDLFDEAVGEGLAPVLATRAENVVGIDVSLAVVEAARRRYPHLEAHRADVRELPWGDRRFDAVVSPSSLDHFDTLEEFSVALRELWRILRPGGRLLISMDNAANPVVALRNALPAVWLRRSGLVPYHVGATCGPTGLKRLLDAAGFDVRACEPLMHCPRVLAVAVSRRIERRGDPRLERRALSFLMGMERLSRAPLRFRTGHFISCLAFRRPG